MAVLYKQLTNSSSLCVVLWLSLVEVSRPLQGLCAAQNEISRTYLDVPSGQSDPPFSLLPLTTLQGGNRPRASTTQTTHPGHALVQWASSGDHLSGATSSRPVFLNFNARRVVPERREHLGSGNEGTHKVPCVNTPVCGRLPVCMGKCSEWLFCTPKARLAAHDQYAHLDSSEIDAIVNVKASSSCLQDAAV